MNLNIFHKSGLVFMGIAFVLLFVYFLLGAGRVNISAESAGRNRWRDALRRVTQIAVFLAIVSVAGLMPKPVEQFAEKLAAACVGWFEPIGRQIPGIKGLF